MRACLLLLSLSTVVQLHAAERPSALGALQALPKGEAKNLARIEAREGTPRPEQWHFIVYAPGSENGLREYVVVGKDVVATRTISQFAEKVAAEDVIGGGAIKVDSGKLTKLAEQYALANNTAIASINYELRKEGEGAAPLWAITCFDTEGAELGALLISAAEAKVISRTGFPVEPQKSGAPKQKPKVVAERLPQSPAPASASQNRQREMSDVEIAQEPLREEGSEPLEESMAEGELPPTQVRRSSQQRVSAPSVTRRVTTPVRRVIRRLLPF